VSRSTPRSCTSLLREPRRAPAATAAGIFSDARRGALAEAIARDFVLDVAQRFAPWDAAGAALVILLDYVLATASSTRVAEHSQALRGIPILALDM